MLALRRTLVSPRFALFVRTLVGVCLMACIGPLSAFAVNLNEAPGSPTNATFVGGPGGDSISAYSGDLELAVPIGPRWNLPGLSWGLSLNYSSKIWRLRSGLTIATELERRGAFGIGWRLTMGRVFQMCRYGCAGLNNLHYEDSNGTLHPIMIDPGTPGVP
ncbi:MAG TPA: hypothetical protein VE404_05340, partial [Verrucomicrobiae bacterium]|nr:hypothetical protein [Verrucomicrobiae bacterium]